MSLPFNNESGLEFDDISSELFREYHFTDAIVHIDEPLKLHVSKSGGHRIFDALGQSHYIPKDWYHLSWVAKPGQPHFVR